MAAKLDKTASEFIADGYLPAEEVAEFNPARFEFRWSDDYQWFKPIKLLWWDNQSYISYQTDDS